MHCWIYTFVFAFLALAIASDGKELLRSGVWDIAVLIPGKGLVPPTFLLRSNGTSFRSERLSFDRFQRALDAAAESIGLTYTQVPADEPLLCHMPAAAEHSWSFRTTQTSMEETCNTFELSGEGLNDFERDGALTQKFDTPQPLLSHQWNGSCGPTPWLVKEVTGWRLSDSHFIFIGEFDELLEGRVSQCTTFLEAVRRPDPSSTNSPQTSLYSPLLLIGAVLVMRVLPRYILPRRGQIDMSSHRGNKRVKLSAERRAELLGRQREIIEQMKAEDAAAQK